MEKSNARRWTVTPRTSWLVYGGGLILTLLGVSLPLYFNLGARPLQETPIVLDLALPLATPAPAAAHDRPTETPDPAIDASYRRAVQAQMAVLASRQATPPATPGPDPTAVPGSVPAAAVELEVITVGASLNVRAEPGIHAPVIASVAPGTRLRALALNAEGTWIQAHIPHHSEPGWVFAGLVQVASGHLAALPTADPAAQPDRNP